MGGVGGAHLYFDTTIADEDQVIPREIALLNALARFSEETRP